MGDSKRVIYISHVAESFRKESDILCLVGPEGRSRLLTLVVKRLIPNATNKN